MRSTGASGSDPAERRVEPAEQDVGVVHDRPGGADHDHQPAEDEDREVHLQVVRSSQRLIGSTNQSTSARPAAVRTARSGRPSRATGSARGRGSASETPSAERDASFGAARPTPDEQQRRARCRRPAEQPAPAPPRLGRRLGQVADRGDDVHPADAPRRERDDHERQQDADRVGDARLAGVTA